jgi:hypothetical protein
MHFFEIASSGHGPAESHARDYMSIPRGGSLSFGAIESCGVISTATVIVNSRFY